MRGPLACESLHNASWVFLCADNVHAHAIVFACVTHLHTHTHTLLLKHEFGSNKYDTYLIRDAIWILLGPNISSKTIISP